MHDEVAGPYRIEGMPDVRGRKSRPEEVAALYQRREYEKIPLLLTCEEVAAIAGVDRRTIARMCDAGELRACRFGRAWRINRDWFLKYTSAMAPKRTA